MALSEKEIANVNKKNKNGMTPFYAAINNQDIYKVMKFLELPHLDFNIKGSSNEPLLFFAFKQINKFMSHRKEAIEILYLLLDRHETDKCFVYENNDIRDMIAQTLNDVKIFKKYENKSFKSQNDNSILIGAIENKNHNIVDYILSYPKKFDINYVELLSENIFNNIIHSISIQKQNKKNEKALDYLLKKFLSVSDDKFESDLYLNSLLDQIIKNDNVNLLNKLMVYKSIDINYSIENMDLFKKIFKHSSFNILSFLFSRESHIDNLKGLDSIYHCAAENHEGAEPYSRYSFYNSKKDLYTFIKLINKHLNNFTPELYAVYLNKGRCLNFDLNDLNKLDNFSINSDIVDDKCRTIASILASENDHYYNKKLFKWLKDNGYDFKMKDSAGNTLLHEIGKSAYVEKNIRMLKEINIIDNAFINEKNKDGDTFLHIVAKKAYLNHEDMNSIILFALQSGFDFDLKNNKKQPCFLIEYPDINKFNENFCFHMKQVIEKMILNKIEIQSNIKSNIKRM